MEINFDTLIANLNVEKWIIQHLLDGNVVTVRDFFEYEKTGELLRIRTFGRKSYTKVLLALGDFHKTARMFYEPKLKFQILTRKGRKESPHYQLGYKEGFASCRNKTIKFLKSLDKELYT